jgi:prolyl oligopeptidase PreP (S9A serine peptidase family)
VASDNDDRVNPFHSLKFLAQLQSDTNSLQPHLLFIEKDGGHTTSSLKQEAYIYSFIFKQLGMGKRIKY